MNKEKNILEIPSIESLEQEIKRRKEKRKFKRLLLSTINILVGVAGISILLSFLLFPVLQIYGVSMTPTLQDGQVALCVKTSDIHQGDIIAFYYNNKILVKRVIAISGDWFDMDKNGQVYINHKELNENYVDKLNVGECDLELPYQVPEDRYFVMGDHRETSIDSRSSVIGTISEEQVVGKVYVIIWPFKDFHLIK